MTIAQLKNALALLLTEEGKATKAAVKGKKKGRTLTQEQKDKMAEGRRKAAAAKAKPEKAKPAAKAVAKPKPEFVGETFEGNGHTVVLGEGQKSKAGRVYVPFHVDGQYAGSIRAELARAFILVARAKCAEDMAAHCDLAAE